MRRALLCLALTGAARPAAPSELFGGLLAHDVDSPLTRGGFEEGADFQLGWRGERIRALRAIGSPSPYALVSVATGGETYFAAAGVTWRIGGRVYLRPGIGIAVHSRGDGAVGGIRTDLGSRILFEPELGVGVLVSDRLSIEAAWVHLSHAQLFGRQNPGMDSVGIRISYRLR